MKDNNNEKGEKMNTRVIIESDVRLTRKQSAALDKIADHVGKMDSPTFARIDACQVVSLYGLGAYRGGRHVAIHASNRNGTLEGERLAIITSDNWR